MRRYPQVQNAVSLNSVMVNVARAVGPAIAGAVIASLDVGVCFLANAASYLAVLAALAQMRTDRTDAPAPLPHGSGQLREGLGYVAGLPALWLPLAMMALIGTLAYEFQVVLPVMATTGLGGDARTYGFLTAAMGAGAVVGGLGIAAFGRAGALPVVISAFCFGVALLGAAAAGQVGAELAALVVVGVASTAFQASATTTLQLTTDPGFRGRVMALWSMTFLGSTPIGGPIVGAVAEHLGARAALALGATACLTATALGILVIPQIPSAARLLSLTRATTAHPEPGLPS